MHLPMNRRLLAARGSGIRRFSALARGTPGCISLALGEPEEVTPLPLREAAKDALDRGLTHYPPNCGEAALREALARYGEREFGLAFSPEEVTVTLGAAEALYIALTGVLDPGSEAVIPLPAYPAYREIVELAGGVCRFLDTSREGFRITRESLLPLVGPRTRVIVLCSPSNPTGCVLDEASLAAVREAAEGRPVFLLWDGVYRQLAPAEIPGPGAFRELRDRLLLVGSFSKAWAMAGWRAGWLMAGGPAAAELQKLHQCAVSSACSFVQPACLAALELDPAPARERYRRRRELAAARLSAMGLSFPPAAGGFYLFPRISPFGLSSEEFCLRLIREAGVGLVPGSCFGCEGYVRLSCAPGEATLSLALDRLEGFLRRLGRASP